MHEYLGTSGDKLGINEYKSKQMGQEDNYFIKKNKKQKAKTGVSQRKLVIIYYIFMCPEMI